MSLDTFLILAIVIRVVLDLSGIVRSTYRLDGAYCVLFLFVSIVLLIKNQRDVFGYACIFLCVFWGLKAFFAFKRTNN